jgi:hypothetical protein
MLTLLLLVTVFHQGRMKSLLKAIHRYSNTVYRWLLVKAYGMTLWYRISRALSLLACLVSFLQACNVYSEDLMPGVPGSPACRWAPTETQKANESEDCWLVYPADPSISRVALLDGSACYEGLECLILRPGGTLVQLADSWEVTSGQFETRAEAVSCEVQCPTW